MPVLECRIIDIGLKCVKGFLKTEHSGFRLDERMKRTRD